MPTEKTKIGRFRLPVRKHDGGHQGLLLLDGGGNLILTFYQWHDMEKDELESIADIIVDRINK